MFKNADQANKFYKLKLISTHLQWQKIIKITLYNRKVLLITQFLLKSVNAKNPVHPVWGHCVLVMDTPTSHLRLHRSVKSIKELINLYLKKKEDFQLIWQHSVFCTFINTVLWIITIGLFNNTTHLQSQNSTAALRCDTVLKQVYVKC